MRIVIFILFILLLLILLRRDSIKEYFSAREYIDKHFSADYDISYDKPLLKPDCIFVSIASYRDAECSRTVKLLYDMADEPGKIFCGIVSQNSPENREEECVPDNFEYKNQVRVVRLLNTEAKGPTWGRYLASRLWDGEEYYFQIDSHIFMKDGWDSKIKGMYRECPSKKAILSHYPPANEEDDYSTHTCGSHYENSFHIISEAQVISKQSKPFRTPYVAAGLLFGKSLFLRDVPFDPYLPYMFQGEEILLATRLWTHGWDVYNLPYPIATHNYDRDDKPRFWNDNSHENWGDVQNEVNKRYYYLIGQNGDNKIEDYFIKNEKELGMGNERSIKSWFEFAGIDPEGKKVNSRCGYLFDEIKNEWIKQ